MNGSLFAVQITGSDIKLLRIRKENGTVFAESPVHIRSSEGKEDRGPFRPASRLGDLREESGEENPQALLILNSEDLDFQDFSYPFETDRKVRNAIEFELSADYPADHYLQDHIQALAREPGYHMYLAAMISRPVLAERIHAVEDAGFRIIGITADVSTLGAAFRLEEEALVMETGERHTLFALFRFGLPVLLRKIPIGVQALVGRTGTGDQGAGNQLLAEIKRTIHSFRDKTGFHLNRLYVTGSFPLFEELTPELRQRIPAEILSRPEQDFDVVMEGASPETDIHGFASLIGAAAWKRKGGFFHFLKDEFMAQDSGPLAPRLIRWGAGFAAVFLLLLILSYGLNLLVLRERRDFLQSEMRETFTSAFPQVTRIVDEVKQAKNLLDLETSAITGGNPQGNASLLDAFRGISATIPGDIPFQIVSLFWETGKIEIYGLTDSFKTVNAIQELLAGHNGFTQVTISNARHREGDQDVEFKLSIRLAG